VYGSNPDANILEKAVTWVIIIIVSVFDPLAVILLLASQYSFQWFRRAEEENKQPKSIDDFVPQPQTLVEDEVLETKSEPFISPATSLWPFPAAAYIQTTHTEPVVDPFTTQPTALGGDITASEELHEEDDDYDENDTVEIREAKRNWKHDHPGDSLKRHRRLLENGSIDRLPWEEYLKAAPDFTDNEAAEEAAKWALEQVEETKKKDNSMDGTGTGSTDSQDSGKLVGYIQNAEQNESTICKRSNRSKDKDDSQGSCGHCS